MKKIFKKIILFIQLIQIKVFFKYRYYNLNADREYNDQLIKKNSLDKNNMINVLSLYNYDFYDPKLSFHYSLFAGLSKNKNHKKILEIGTNLGKFTNFVSNIFPLSTIYTCDLATDDELFDRNFSKDPKASRENFLHQRNINLKNKKTMKFLETLKKYQQQILVVLFLLLLLKGCGTNSEVTKLRKEVQTQREVLDKLPTKKDLQIEGLKSEKRMIQATDRKMLDVQRQTEIDKEIEKLNK